MARAPRSPWNNGIQMTHTWRCECNRLVSNKLKACDKCGREKKVPKKE